MAYSDQVIQQDKKQDDPLVDSDLTASDFQKEIEKAMSDITLRKEAEAGTTAVAETDITAQAVDDSDAIDISQIDLEDPTGVAGQDIEKALSDETADEIPIDSEVASQTISELISRRTEGDLEGIPPAEEIPLEGVLPETIDLTKPIGLQKVFSTEKLLEPPDLSTLSNAEIAKRFGVREDHPAISALTYIRNGIINPDPLQTDPFKDFYEDSEITEPQIAQLREGGTYEYEGIWEKEQREKREKLERLEQSTSMFAPMQKLLESDSWVKKLNPALITASALQGIYNFAYNIYGPDGLFQNDEWMVDPLKGLESSVISPDWLESYKDRISFTGPVTPEMAKKYMEESEQDFQKATKLDNFQAWTIANNLLDTGGRGVRQIIFGEPEVETGHIAADIALDILTAPETYLGYGAYKGMAKAGFTYLPRTRIFLGTVSKNVSIKSVRLKRATYEALSRVMGDGKAFELTKLSFPKMLREVQKMYDSPTAIRLKEKLQTIAERVDDGFLLDTELAVKGKALWKNHIIDRLDQGMPIEDILGKKDWNVSQLTRAMFTHNPVDTGDILRIENEATKAFRNGRLTTKELANTGMYPSPTKDSIEIKSIVGKDNVEFFGGFGFVKPSFLQGKGVPILTSEAKKFHDFFQEVGNFIFPLKRWVNSVRHAHPDAEEIYVGMKDGLRQINHETFQSHSNIANMFRTKNWRGASRDMTKKEINKFVAAREAYDDQLLSHDFLVKNNLPQEYIKLQTDVNKFFDDHLARAVDAGYDTSKFKNIPPHRYWPHMFVGDYELLRLDRTGSKGVKIVNLVRDGSNKNLLGEAENAFEVGIGDRDYLIDLAEEYMNDPVNQEIVKGVVKKPLVVIRPRRMHTGVKDLPEELLEDLRGGLSDAQIQRMLGDVGEIKTKIGRQGFYDLVKKLDDEASWSTDDIKEILRTRLTIPPPGQKQIILNQMKARTKDYTNWVKDPRLVMEMYSSSMIRKQYLEKMIRPLYKILERGSLRKDPSARKVLEDRLDYIMRSQDPELMPSIARMLRGVRSTQAARKLWRPASSLANALGPYQFAYPELGFRYLIWAEGMRKTKKGAALLKEIQASGAVHVAGVEGGRASGAIMSQLRGAKRDLKDLRVLRAAGNTMLTNFNAVEARNRGVVPLAAYLKATKKLKLSHKEAIRLARDADDSFNFVYNEADLPKGILLFPTIGQFQGFATNALYQYTRMTAAALRHPLTKSEYGVNHVHRAVRLWGAQMVFGGIRSLPFALRYGTIASLVMSVDPDWSITDRMELKDTIDDFIIENPLARGIFTYSSNLISKATDGAFPAIDLSTRLGVIGDEVPLVGGFIGRDMEAMLGVNGTDLFAVMKFFNDTVLGAGPGRPISLAGRQLMASDPALRDIMATIIGFRNGGAQYDFGRDEAHLLNLTKAEMVAQLGSFPSFRKNQWTDKSYVEESSQRKRDALKDNLVLHYREALNKLQADKNADVDFIGLTSLLQDAILQEAINPETFGEILTNSMLKQIIPRLQMRIDNAPPALKTKLELFQGRLQKLHPYAPPSVGMPGVKVPILRDFSPTEALKKRQNEGSNVYIEQLLEALKKRQISGESQTVPVEE